MGNKELTKTEPSAGLRVHRRKMFDRPSANVVGVNVPWSPTSDTATTWEKQSTGWQITKQIIDPAGAPRVSRRPQEDPAL